MTNHLPHFAAIGALVLLTGCASAPAPAPENGTDVVAVEGPDLLLTLPKGGMPMTEWIGLAQRVTGNVYTYSGRDLEGVEPVEILGTVRVPREEFGKFFTTVLYVHGFSLVERRSGDAPVWEVVPAPRAKGV